MTKYYNAETRNSLEMQFGSLVCKKIVIEKKYVFSYNLYRIDIILQVVI